MIRHYLWLLPFILFGIWFSYFKTPVHVMAYKDHQFINSQVQTFNGYTMTNLEPYEGEFRIFSTEKYQFTQGADISPLDLLVGWGEMANPQIYKQIKWSQSGRFGRWEFQDQPPIPMADLQRQASNMHMIAANKQIAKQLSKIKKDQLVFIKGQLVEISNKEGWAWRSSLSRTDTGNGACELMLVTEIRFLS